MVLIFKLFRSRFTKNFDDDYRFVANENVLSLLDFSLGGRRNRCSKLLQLSESNWVTLAVELRV